MPQGRNFEGISCVFTESAGVIITNLGIFSTFRQIFPEYEYSYPDPLNIDSHHDNSHVRMHAYIADIYHHEPPHLIFDQDQHTHLNF